MQDSNSRNNRYKEAAKIAERKFGGSAWKGHVRAVDPETKEVLYNNGDVIAMAKRNVQRGGQAATALDMLEYETRKPLEELVDKYWYSTRQCEQCKGTINHFNNYIYDKEVRCSLCYKENQPLKFSSPEEKERIEKTYPYIEKYCSFKHADIVNKKRVMNIYLRRVLKLKKEKELNG